MNAYCLATKKHRKQMRCDGKELLCQNAMFYIRDIMREVYFDSK